MCAATSALRYQHMAVYASCVATSPAPIWLCTRSACFDPVSTHVSTLVYFDYSIYRSKLRVTRTLGGRRRRSQKDPEELQINRPYGATKTMVFICSNEEGVHNNKEIIKIWAQGNSTWMPETQIGAHWHPKGNQWGVQSVSQ